MPRLAEVLLLAGGKSQPLPITAASSRSLLGRCQGPGNLSYRPEPLPVQSCFQLYPYPIAPGWFSDYSHQYHIGVWETEEEGERPTPPRGPIPLALLEAGQHCGPEKSKRTRAGEKTGSGAKEEEGSGNESRTCSCVAWATETFVPEPAALEEFHSTLSMRGGVDWAGTVGARRRGWSKPWESEATRPPEAPGCGANPEIPGS